ncbi:MAG TPA: efflux transporter outer membrane subunit [Sphingobium sp.]|nr:efflux transporter outer membrane subunit [Sphingobium sp.]
MRRTLPVFLLLAGCTVGPNYSRPAVPGAEADWSSTAGTAAVDLSPWGTLGDPVLDGLLRTAVVANLDLREADARLQEARAARDAAAGGRLPALDANASATEQQLSANGQLPVNSIPGFNRRFSLFDGGFDASWELDLWGGTRRSVEAADRRVTAAAARRHDTLLQIVAEVARSYASLRGSQAILASTLADARAQADIAGLVHQQFVAGEASRFDDARAEAQARNTAALIEPVRADIRAATSQLALLTGRPPEALSSLVEDHRPLPPTPAIVGVGLRSDLLRRRPDILAAEADLAAATSDIGVQTAQLFPSVSLIGSVGQQARAAGDLTSGDSLRFSVGPSIRWPIFSGGRLRAQIRSADARADAAAARYEKAVLAAFADSETAINRYAAALARAREQDAARAASAIALDLARQRYRAGEDNLLTLLDAQSSYTASDRSATDAQAQAFQAYAALIKALGGGWSDATNRDVTTEVAGQP